MTGALFFSVSRKYCGSQMHVRDDYGVILAWMGFLFRDMAYFFHAPRCLLCVVCQSVSHASIVLLECRVNIFTAVFVRHYILRNFSLCSYPLTKPALGKISRWTHCHYLTHLLAFQELPYSGTTALLLKNLTTLRVWRIAMSESGSSVTIAILA